MTLLELLRQELPKRGGWPEGVTAMFQDWDGEVRFHGKSGSIHLTTVADNHRKGDQIERSDYEHCVVTREQYEATGWDGTGLPPVGVECEMQNDNGQWINVCIIAHLFSDSLLANDNISGKITFATTFTFRIIRLIIH